MAKKKTRAVKDPARLTKRDQEALRHALSLVTGFSAGLAVFLGETEAMHLRKGRACYRAVMRFMRRQRGFASLRSEMGRSR
jgi:2-methylcitrate dehydratase PrpD